MWRPVLNPNTSIDNVLPIYSKYLSSLDIISLSWNIFNSWDIISNQYDRVHILTDTIHSENDIGNNIWFAIQTAQQNISETTLNDVSIRRPDVIGNNIIWVNCVRWFSIQGDRYAERYRAFPISIIELTYRLHNSLR